VTFARTIGVCIVPICGLLLLSPNLNQPFVYWAATAWAIIYSVAALINAVQRYRENKQEKTAVEATDEPHKNEQVSFSEEAYQVEISLSVGAYEGKAGIGRDSNLVI